MSSFVKRIVLFACPSIYVSSYHSRELSIYLHLLHNRYSFEILSSWQLELAVTSSTTCIFLDRVLIDNIVKGKSEVGYF